ncbi:HAMP domain-containing protein [soil metagenome]
MSIMREKPSPSDRANGNEPDMHVLLDCLVAIRRGDFSARCPNDGLGLAGKIYDTLNDIMDLNQRTMEETQRIAEVVGNEGRITQRAEVTGAVGGWAGQVAAINGLIERMAQPMTEMTRVISSVARGDLSPKMSLEIEGRELAGEFLSTARAVNTMVEQLRALASEVSRVARQVGIEGKLGGQAEVVDASGTWKDLTDNVNMMAANLTGQVRNISQVAQAIAKGDLSARVTVEVRGEILELKDTINRMVDQLSTFAAEVTRVARQVGTEGKLGGQAQVEGVAGTWKDLTDNVNMMASNLTSQVRNIAEVTTAVANGDLSTKITVDVSGEILDLKNTINRMVDQLNQFASEVTRVAREVGTDGKLGGQANVPGVAGTWKDLTVNVNSMASNLTGQVRNIAEVATAIADGDLSRKITADVRGEVLQLKITMNTMVEQLRSFASEVSRVAREVGTDGRLGGQAQVEGVAGTWKDLTDNVNRLAANLTTQVRAIAEVATAVTQGNLSRSIDVEAAGEVAALKDNINQMISNLRDTTRANTDQDWLKTNVARFSRLLQGQRDVEVMASKMLSELAPLVDLQAGLFYLAESTNGAPLLRLRASFGAEPRSAYGEEFQPGEGLIGQAMVEKRPMLVKNAPSDYLRISSGLGEAAAPNIAILPVLFEGEVMAVMELASFSPFTDAFTGFLGQLTELLGVVLNTISANMRTEELLKQSQGQAKTLQASELRLKEQREELQKANEELEEKADLLGRQNAEVERKNREIELARQALEEKAAQLVLASKYKSEFLANMSHELRTPLNSMLILSRMLSENSDGNLTMKQAEYARTVFSSGNDLLSLISDILDLSKIESGTVDVEAEEFGMDDVLDETERTFLPVSEGKSLRFSVEVEPNLPTSLVTDRKRFQQVLKNLLANAFKFTEHGGVMVRVQNAKEGWNPENESLSKAERVVSFTVTDTGIGISPEHHRVIFDSFQQAEGGSSRRFGGVGLGLAISREIASLLGGELKLVWSAPGKGSAFTFYMPQRYRKPAARRRRTAETPVPTQGLEQSRVPDAIPATDAPFEFTSAGRVEDDRHVITAGEKVLLIVESDATYANALVAAGRASGWKIVVANTGREGLSFARRMTPAAVVLDLDLPQMDGLTVLDLLRRDTEMRDTPVQVLSGREEQRRSERLGAAGFFPKPSSTDNLADFASKVIQALPVAEEHVVRSPKAPNPVVGPTALAADPLLGGRRILVVDDDIRNIFALTSYLERYKINTVHAESGDEALEALAKNPGVDAILMDIMMPGMDGYETTQRIRQNDEWRNIPIIALTAKAMKGDREKCLAAGASDYIPKPVDTDQLLSLLRVWMLK